MPSSKQKRLAGKFCVYCSDNPAVDEDHIIAAKTFPVKLRGNLPQVPACKECNGRKGAIERELQTILLFSLEDAVQLEQLVQEVPGRFAQNRRLQREITSGLHEEVFKDKEGNDITTGVLDVDPIPIAELYETMTRGFWYSEYNQIMPQSTKVRALGLKAKVIASLLRLLGESIEPIERSYADGKFKYSLFSVDNPRVTFWVYTLFNSAQVSRTVITAEPEVIAVTPQLKSWFERPISSSEPITDTVIDDLFSTDISVSVIGEEEEVLNQSNENEQV